MAPGIPCATHHCRLNESHACGSFDRVTFDLVEILGQAPLDDCPFFVHEVEPLVRRVVRKAHLRDLETPELLNEVVLKTLEAWNRGTQSRIPRRIPELQRFIGQVSIDVTRERLGRMRCSGCFHYQSLDDREGGRCRRSVAWDREPHPHFGHVMAAHTDPRRLVPPCREFSDRRVTFEVSPAIAVSVRSKDDAVERLRGALDLLSVKKPVEATLLMKHKLDGESLDLLARKSGLTRDQVRYKISGAMRELEVILRDSGEIEHGD